MGVCLVSYAVRDATIDRLLADPVLVWSIVEPDDETRRRRELESLSNGHIWSRLFGRKPSIPAPLPLVFTPAELKMVDLDKSWDGINACLQICCPSAPNYFKGSGRVGRIEVGYGTALYHRADVMARIAAEYLRIDDAQLLQAMPAAAMDRAYPKGLWRRNDAQVAGYLVENFAELRVFMRHTVENSLGAILQYT